MLACKGMIEVEVAKSGLILDRVQGFTESADILHVGMLEK